MAGKLYTTIREVNTERLLLGGKIIHEDGLLRIDTEKMFSYTFGRQTKRQKFSLQFEQLGKYIYESSRVVPDDLITEPTMIKIGLLRLRRIYHCSEEITGKFIKKHAKICQKLKDAGFYEITKDNNTVNGILMFKRGPHRYALTKNGFVQKYADGDSNMPSPLNSRITTTDENGNKQLRLVHYLDKNGKPDWDAMAERLLDHVRNIELRLT